VYTQRLDTNVFIEAFGVINLPAKGIGNGSWKEAGEC
jgi:hypothetical protein